MFQQAGKAIVQESCSIRSEPQIRQIPEEARSKSSFTVPLNLGYLISTFQGLIG
jgi:hypothetical protein